ncbi:MAG TPA: DHH family phosphoesterase [Candidatus Saccharimonadales bacterium]|nr:DHH family phosphoesterase [Candidatus Saccharimonadales bacterium]
MDLTPKQQTSEAIRQAESILIVTGQNPTIDQVVAVVGLASVLRKFGKKVSAVISDPVPSRLSFLETDQPDRTMNGLRDFILKVDLKKSEVDKLKYTVEDQKLNIHITPFKGAFAPSDVTFAYGTYHFDIIIVLGVPSRNRIDRVFDKAPEMLDETPIINIDFHRVNENYGAVNLIDSYAASLCEILVALAESLQTGLIDEPIATAWLAGIMASTDRFTATHTTAKALTVAAQLMAAGAKQQQIVKSLYKSGGDGRTSQSQPQPKAAEPAPKPVEKALEADVASDVPAAESNSSN